LRKDQFKEEQETIPRSSSATTIHALRIGPMSLSVELVSSVSPPAKSKSSAKIASPFCCVTSQHEATNVAAQGAPLQCGLLSSATPPGHGW
jgi:hypothetical protein